MQRKTLYATDGETLKVSNQWAAETEKRGTSVSSSTWEYSGSGSLAGASLSGTLTNTATLASGEVLIATRPVVVDGMPPLDYQI